MRFLLISSATVSSLLAGPYPPAADTAGTDAIPSEDARFVSWASGYQPPQYGTEVEAVWKTPAKALGMATADKDDIADDIVCLGNGGKITMFFPHPIRDGTGPDFAVFENSFSNGFLELAFVEVSSDGVNFTRFPNDSLTPSVVGAFSTSMNPTNLHGLAGKYRGGFGTPFDLAALAASPLLDRQHIRFVRLVDIAGGGDTKDTSGNPIYDPSPTIGSGGFDLDAIGVIHQNNGEFQIIRAEIAAGNFHLEWESNPGSSYRIETSTTLASPPGWSPVTTTNGRIDRGTTPFPLPIGEPRRFWRVVRLGD